jgi:peptidoglycan/xylan/chitin deacetylase (PgdA/CDA1 family)
MRLHPRPAERKRGVKATFFTLGWIAERYPNGARHRRRRAMNSPATDMRTSGHRTSEPANSRKTSSASKTLLEDIGRQRRCAVTARRASRSAAETCGHWTCLHGRLPLQLQHLPGPARSLRNAGRAAFRVLPERQRPGLLEVPITTVRHDAQESAGGRRRIFPLLALSRISRWLLRRVNRHDRNRRCSISIRGNWTRASRASTGSAPRRASAIT